ncbi:MAG: PQQ-binding-like beta-propeller repeat protein, partial [Asgard group archaeon]|nr:PQQ-binding-like beta-propeller repeat protein [Asgard group archaeon]
MNWSLRKLTMFSKIKSYFVIVIILATPLNSLFLSMLVSSPNSSSAILSSNYSEGTGELSPNAETGLHWSSTSGLTGEITSSPIIDYITESELVQIVYIGTEIGLTKIQVETGNIYWTHATPGAILSITPVEDLTGDSNKEVLITIDNQQFNNTEMLNGLTGEIIWSFRPTETVWQEGIGFSQQETRTWSSLLIEDITDDGTSDVLISSYRSVFALDAEDGSLLWQQSASNDVWNTELMDDDIDSDGYNDIAIGSQDGELMLLSGYDGKVIWEIIAAEEAKYIDQTTGTEFTFKRNVYDVRKCFDMNNDFKKDILTTDENGYCAVYDVVTGELIDRVIAYISTGAEQQQATFGSKNFYNPLSIDVVDDYGLTKVFTASRSDAIISNLTLALLNLGMGDLYVDWSINSINIEDVRSIATSVTASNYTKVIIPTGVTGSSQFERTIEVYALFNYSLMAQWNLTVLAEENEFQLNFGDSSDGQYPFAGNHAFFVDDYQGSPEEEVLIYLAGNGLYLLDGDTGELLWSQVKSSKVKIESYFDVNSDSTIDILRKEYYFKDYYSPDRFRIPRITMISGETGEEIWNHEIDDEDRELVGGGYLNILQAEDITNDSVPDLWLAQQEYENWEFNLVNVSKVKLLDGATGTVVWESLPANSTKVYSKEQLRLTSMTTIADQDGDDIQDVLVGCQRHYIYCISGADGEYLWNITRDVAPFDPNYRDWVPYH